MHRRIKLTALVGAVGLASLVGVCLPADPEVTPEMLDAYVGQYELAPSELLPVPPRRIFTVRRETGRLFIRLSGRPERELRTVSATEFEHVSIEATVQFHRGDEGSVVGLAMQQYGQQFLARRISDELPRVTRRQQEARDGFIDWVQQTKITDDAGLAFLGDVLQGKRAVYLGEPTHYLEQLRSFRIGFLDTLFEQGFRFVALEGVSEAVARRVDRFLETGEESGLNGLQDAPLIRKLKAMSDGDNRVHVFSFDLDNLYRHADLGYEDLREELRGHESAAAVTSLLALLLQPDDEQQTEELLRLEAIVAHISRNSRRLEKTLGAASLARLRRSAVCLRDSLRFSMLSGLIDETPVDISTPEWFEALEIRETAMCNKVRSMLDQLPESARLVMMGHVMHLSKNSDRLRWGPDGSGMAMWQSVGSCADEMLDGATYAIWMLHDRGTFVRPRFLGGEGRPREFDTKPGTLENLLGRAGSRFVLPLERNSSNEPFLFSPFDFAIQGAAYASGVIGSHADAIYFVRDVSVN